jgi:hypothetical protein
VRCGASSSACRAYTIASPNRRLAYACERILIGGCPELANAVRCTAAAEQRDAVPCVRGTIRRIERDRALELRRGHGCIVAVEREESERRVRFRGARVEREGSGRIRARPRKVDRRLVRPVAVVAHRHVRIRKRRIAARIARIGVDHALEVAQTPSHAVARAQVPVIAPGLVELRDVVGTRRARVCAMPEPVTRDEHHRCRDERDGH